MSGFCPVPKSALSGIVPPFYKQEMLFLKKVAVIRFCTRFKIRFMKKLSTLPFFAATSRTDTWLPKAEIFASHLPQSQGARRDGRNIILTYIVDGKRPADQVSYAEQHIDAHAVAAFRQIFEGADEAELLMKDIRLTFTVLFWDGQALSDIEFTYYMSDLLFLSGSKPGKA